MPGTKRIYFNELAPRWDSMPWPPDADERAADFCRRAWPREAGWLLDVGCGTGLLAPHVLRAGDGDTRLIELDFAPAMVTEARRKNPDERLLPVCADALRMPFPPESFGAVLCFGILPHLGEPGKALRALWEMVCPGGLIAVGHFLGSAQLNERHRSIGGPVGEDLLLAAAELGELLRSLGATVTDAVDLPERYLVRAEKGLS